MELKNLTKQSIIGQIEEFIEKSDNKDLKCILFTVLMSLKSGAENELACYLLTYYIDREYGMGSLKLNGALPPVESQNFTFSEFETELETTPRIEFN
ncbi:MAG TPA: hypothetical protein EYQ50_00245 [Verrucomicrobiales bacterium]|nr:hypothetical protein [Verrucomicrobiales bacterium]HIL71999.1 hypothetical protein [Verrucomicrobiota bacterium]